MPKGYWVSRVDVADAVTYKLYVDGAAAPFAQYGAKFLARGGQYVAAEGVARARNVIIEFPSLQAAVDCYNSPAYQAARAHRGPVSEVEIVIVEGIEP